MELMKVAENISEYFNTNKHSDITIRFSGQEIKAHKLVLAQGSDYFKACFEGKFAERGTRTIELHEDNPLAVKAMIAWLYGLEADRNGNISKRPFVIQFSVEGMEYAKYQADVYMTASKYLVPSLQKRASQEFSLALTRVGNVSGYPNKIDEVARYVFPTYPDAEEVLREPLVDFFITHIDNVKEEAPFKQLLQDLPDLAVLIIKTLAGQKTDSATRRLNAMRLSFRK